MLLLQAQCNMHILIQNVMPISKAVSKTFLLRNWLEFTAFEWTIMIMVFVSKLLLVKVSCNMGANNTITTASSLSSGAPQRPTSILNSKYLLTTFCGRRTKTWSTLLMLSLRKTLSLSEPFRGWHTGFGCQGVRKYMLHYPFWGSSPDWTAMLMDALLFAVTQEH